MLARLGKYGQIQAFPFFFVPSRHSDHLELALIHCLVTWQTCFCKCLITVFCITGLETFLGWLTKAPNDFTNDRPKVHRTPQHGHLWCWDTEQLSLDWTHTYTHIMDLFQTLTPLRMTQKPALVPERHFRRTNRAIHGQTTLNHCVATSFMMMLSCLTTKQYWIKILCCCKTTCTLCLYEASNGLWIIIILYK